MSAPDLATAVQQLAQQVSEFSSHLPRIGALEHREILLAAASTRLARSVDELNDRIYKFADEARARDAALHKKLDELLARKP